MTIIQYKRFNATLPKEAVNHGTVIAFQCIHKECGIEHDPQIRGELVLYFQFLHVLCRRSAALELQRIA